MRPLKALKLAALLVLALTVGGSGYFLRGLREHEVLALPTSLPELDLFINEQSFSEVENAKALLEALSKRYVTEVRIRRHLDSTQASPGEYAPSPMNQPSLSGALDELEKGVELFEGTGQEMEVAADLLRALKHARQYDRWLALYLQALYQHPTHELDGDFADDAVKISQAIGHAGEVFNAFRHLSNIPFDFGTKQRVQKRMSPLSSAGLLSRNDAVGSSPLLVR